ncbi:tetratricopeptide repeat protein, partial [bacterium]|nr:tetratricopeptide repeat protein [bacterium]
MPEPTLETMNRTARELYEKGLAALERNNFDYAMEMLRQCLGLEPNFTKGRQYLRAAQVKNATGGTFRRLASAAKAQGALAKARMAITKNPTDAMNIAEEVLSVDPRSGQALQLLAEAADAAGYPETTIQTLDLYLKLNPKDLKVLHWLGQTHATLKDYPAAHDVYERILQMKPTDFDAQKALKDVVAQGAMRGGGWEQEGDFRKALKDKDESVALEQQSRVVRAEDMIENLIQEKLRALKTDPDNPVLRRELGQLYGQKGQFAQALEILEQLFTHEAGADPTLEREIAEIKGKRIDSLVATKKKELAANPDQAATIEQQIADLEGERTTLALEDTRRLVDRYPNDLLYRFEFGVLLMRSGDVQEAVEQFQRSVGQPQKRVTSLNYLGQCFQQLGLHDLAVEQFK